MVKPKNKTFIKITNQDIFNEIKSLGDKVGSINTRSKINAAGIGILFVAVLFLLENVLGKA